jgi:hypothetical protein
MSYRNGDKSRENRLRKAREKMRLKVRSLRPSVETNKAASAAGKDKK